jgi:hypothetical protein
MVDVVASKKLRKLRERKGERNKETKSFLG